MLAAFLTVMTLVAFSSNATARFINVYEKNLVGTCAGKSPKDAAVCLDEVLKSIKNERALIGEFKSVLAQIRGPLLGNAEPHPGCVVTPVNEVAPRRTPSSVAAGPQCAAKWNAYRTAISALMTESCVTLAVYRDAEKITRLKDAAEKAEDAYDACFDRELETTHKSFTQNWPRLNSIDDFFQAHKTAQKDYLDSNVDGQYRVVFAACKSAVIALSKDNRRAADLLVTSGICR